MKVMFKQISKLQIFITLFFLAYVAWWISFQSVLEEQGTSVQWLTGTYGIIALFGAGVGFVAAHKWGGIKTVLGKSLTFFSLGLLAQEAGQLIYQYYIYVDKIDIPYPSLGDIAYFGSVILYIIAAIYLTKISGVKFALKETKYKVIAVLVPIVLLSVSYTVLLRNNEYDTSQPLTVFLDFGYPMGQAIYVSLALVAYLLSRKQLGGVMKSGVLLIIFALALQFIADFSFVYQSSRESYVVGGYVDLAYLVSYFAMATAMIKFLTIHNGIMAKSQATTKQSAEKSEDHEEKVESSEKVA